MCTGQNAASLALRYINAQLSSLYDNATECLKKHDDVSRPESAAFHALSHFTYYGEAEHDSDPPFSIDLDKPKLEFVCNHEAILRLQIKGGHFTYTQAGKERYYDCKGVAISLRVAFTVDKIPKWDDKIGDGHELLIPLLILDILHPKSVSFEPEINRGRETFEAYLKRYLQCLYRAGNHAMFSLPDFDDQDGHPSIDYALLERRLSWTAESVYGISVSSINKQLSLKWLKDETAPNYLVANASWREAVLAGHHSFRVRAPEDLGFHYQIRIGPPRIEALCAKDVVMSFRIEEVTFYESEEYIGKKDVFERWEIAFVFDVDAPVLEMEGNVTTLNLKRPRLFKYRCTFDGIDDKNEQHLLYQTTIRRFFREEYIKLLSPQGRFVLYHEDKRGRLIMPDPVRFPATLLPSPLETNDGVHETHMGNFDEIVTIAQRAVNKNLGTLWSYAEAGLGSKYACALVRRWSFGEPEQFSADFRPMSVRFLSGNKALVWVNINHATLHTQGKGQRRNRGGSKDSEISDSCLAFEVDIRMSHVDDYSPSQWDVAEEWRERFLQSPLWKAHGMCADRVLKHISLDFENATLVHEFSDLGNIRDANDVSDLISRFRAVVPFIQEHYLPALASHGLNILYSIPVWQHGAAPGSYGLTDVAFQVYAEHDVTRYSWPEIPRGHEPVLAILGMTGFRPLAARTLDGSFSWLLHVNHDAAHVKLALSERVFLKEHLLERLASVNADTTLIARSVGVDLDGDWKLDLVAWRDYAAEPPAFELVEDDSRDGVVYRWESVNSAESSHQHRGAGRFTSGRYSVTCATTNELEVSASSIKARGEVRLEMKHVRGNEELSALSTASWDATFAIRTEGGAIKVELTGSPQPQLSKTLWHGAGAAETFPDPQLLLRSHLPLVVDLAPALEELQSFEAVWSGCYPRLQAYGVADPACSKQGDVLFDMHVLGEPSIAAA